MGPRNLYQLLEQASLRHGDAAALHQPVPGDRRHRYQTCSWSDYRRAVEEVAAGLRGLGVARGDVVAIDCETRMEFYFADLGVMACGAVSAALYTSYPAPDLVNTIRVCGAKVAFAEDPKTLAALRDAPVEQWILITGQAPGVITLDELRAIGRRAIDKDPTLIERMTSAVQPCDHAILYLTSGATGEPKMALVSHGALLSNLAMGPSVLPLGPEDRTVAFLPSAHIAQRVVIELLPLVGGMPVTFSESLLKLPQEIKHVRPTVMLAPPRMWERIYSSVCTEIRKRPVILQKAFWGALGLGLAAAGYRREGKPVPAHIRGPLKVADRVFFRKIRSRLGGQLKVPASGAAPLGKDLAEFYEAIGMPLVEGYGLTEGGVVALNPLDRPRPGSIGKALPGVELRISGDGELLVKSPTVFSGYLDDGKATAEVLRDGWLHTGDVAYIDDEGYVYITGRTKEILVSSTGKNIFPSRIENLFKTEPLISQVLLLGDRLPYLIALFTVNPAAAETLDGMRDYQGRTTAELLAAPPVSAAIRKAVERVNRQLAPFEQVRKFRILERDFSIERGELTATMKVRRNRVMENFRGEIEELYG
ncbi:MAG TPA: AMP-dependent synthetase/ligase [Bryobacteraceae bacterium]|nr:AMP-dependent synthetase/ligase [Bryobacteraceae bacterium]